MISPYTLPLPLENCCKGAYGPVREEIHGTPLSLVRMSLARARIATAARRRIAASGSRPAQVGRDVLISKLVAIILDDVRLFSRRLRGGNRFDFPSETGAHRARARCHWRGENANEMDLHNSKCDVTSRLFCANVRPCKSPASDVHAPARRRETRQRIIPCLFPSLPARPSFTTS